MTKYLLTILSLVSFSLTGLAGSKASKVVSNIGCFRDVIYSTASYIEAEYLESHTEMFPMITTFKSKKTIHVPALRKDITDQFIQIVAKYSSQDVPEIELDQDAAVCITLKSTLKRLASDTNKDDAGVYLPTFNGEIFAAIRSLNVSKDAKSFILNTILKTEECKNIEGSVAAGAGVAVAAGLTAAYCHGHGGKRWISLSPQIYGGVGGGMAVMVGGKKTVQQSGWFRYLDASYSGIFGGGYILGSYWTGSDQGIEGGGGAYGTPGFAYSMAGARLNVKMIFLADDQDWILRKLGRPQTESNTSLSGTDNVFP